ncbi:MAG: hypothetical protein JWO38_768 [Gemmataceae bacterium]|nr:hypothetical protein [Gemmataceae bacterium]
MPAVATPEARDLPEYAGVPFDRKRIKTSLPPVRGDGPAPLATFLGLFSIGLGLWEATAPRSVAERTGVRFPGLLQVYGVREMAAGIGILSTERPAFWLWSRVAGDALDLATLAAAYVQVGGADRRKNLEAAAAVLGVTVLDVLCACEHGRS